MLGWQHGAVLSALGSINEGAPHRTRVLLVMLKMQDQKKEDHIAGQENAGLENVGPYDRAGKCRT